MKLLNDELIEVVDKYLREEHGVTPDDIKGSFPFRACVNGRYFQKLRQALPDYPWSFTEVTKKKVLRGFAELATVKVDREGGGEAYEPGTKAELYFVISSVHSKWIWAVDDINQREVLSSYYFVRKNIERFKKFVKGERDEGYTEFIGHRD